MKETIEEMMVSKVVILIYFGEVISTNCIKNPFVVVATYIGSVFDFVYNYWF
jgi:hypothetical protein